MDQRALTLNALLNSPKRLANNLYRRLHGMPVSDPLESLAQVLADSIEVEPVGRSNVIEISYRGSNPDQAAAFVNDLIEAHTDRIARLEGETEALPFWDAKIKEAAQRSREAQAALDAFEAEQGPDLLARDEVQLKTVLAKLEADRIALETRIFEAEAQISFLSQELLSQPETIEEEIKVSESELAKLIEEQILELEMERTELLTRYTPQSTPVRQLDRQIESLQNRLETTDAQTLAETTTGPNPARQQVELDLMRARGDLTSTRARLAALGSQIEVYRERLTRLELSSAELARLTNEVETASEAHQTYLRQAEAARFDRSLGASKLVNVSLIDPAEVPGAPERSYRLRKVVQGTLIGLVLGILIALPSGLDRPDSQGLLPGHALDRPARDLRDSPLGPVSCAISDCKPTSRRDAQAAARRSRKETDRRPGAEPRIRSRGSLLPVGRALSFPTRSRLDARDRGTGPEPGIESFGTRLSS